MIELKNVSKGFNGKAVIKNVEVTMQPGKCNLIIGTSGSGKTVLTKCMVGLFEPDEGIIYYNGEQFSDISKYEKIKFRRQIGMLFQGSALFDSLNVEQNVMFPLDMFSKMSQAEKLKRVNEVLARVNLVDANKKFPSEISGGMKKRVGIARAIVLNPKFFHKLVWLLIGL
jgi:phospholipid/cholesterol/gamma-HCH transport system ATP-binding protein